MARLLPHGRMPIMKILSIALIMNLALAGSALAGCQCWNAFDDAAANDNPDGLQGTYAPDNIRHRGGFYDQAFNHEDYLLDYIMRWEQKARDTFRADPALNYVHEVRTDVRMEADAWYWTDLPRPDHNEDDGYWEEIAQGYEEKELGWTDPVRQIPIGADRRVWTAYWPTANKKVGEPTTFHTESEITKKQGWHNEWYPFRYDVIGRVRGCCH